VFVALAGWDQVRLALYTSLVKMLLHAKENWVWKIVDYIPFPSFIPLQFFIDLLDFGNIMLNNNLIDGIVVRYGFGGIVQIWW
jgi:hypothetical protein